MSIHFSEKFNKRFGFWQDFNRQYQVIIDDKEISDIKLDQYPVSYIPDSPVFYEELSLLEHLQFTKAMFPENKILIDEVINQFELREHIHKIPSALSKGTRQKLMIAMAIMRTYDVLIADEPFSGLDPRQISVFKKLLIQQKENGKAVLLSSHLLDVVENICDRYVIMRKGKIIADGSKAELMAQANLPADSAMEQLYLQIADEYE